MYNKCDFCRQEFNKDHEYKCPICGFKVKRWSNISRNYCNSDCEFNNQGKDFQVTS